MPDSSISRPGKTVRIASRDEIAGSSRWHAAFAGERKDRRFYELLEDTLKDGFKYRYLIVEDDRSVCAIQPFFVVDQDLLAGVSAGVKKLIAGMRRLWPRFMYARTLMVGCAAGEGHLDGDDATNFATAEALGCSLPELAANLDCPRLLLHQF